ncbi:MAG: glycosyl hydrolase, partial [Bacteroidales bacterium]|nr:glycosyl hydrolase [Bacteroidales bacterium]MDD4436347.1 glycosyl hydrolase [Bacteroidales bacterium]
MKIIGRIIIVLSCTFLFLIPISGQIQNKINKITSDQLQTGFITPPDSIRTSVYWYWISNNISKEGTVNDLHAMKKAGINRAFIGNIGIDHLPYGNIKMFSEEWWEIMHL